MSQQNLEIVQRGYEQFAATGEFVEGIAAPDFVWDMSNFHGWPEQQIYAGAEGARTFLADWAAAWEKSRSASRGAATCRKVSHILPNINGSRFADEYKFP